MGYRVVFEYETESSAMSDVYNCADQQAALQMFNDLRQQLMLAIDPTQCEVVDEPDLYGMTNRQVGCYGFVRIDHD